MTCKLTIYLYNEFIATSLKEAKVVVNGSSSDALPLLSRVLVIGPLLFLFYIDGIKSITLSSHLKLFADSMLLYRPTSTSADYVHLQEHIKRIGMRTNANYLQFNIEKMRVTRKRTGTQPPA